MLGTVQELQLPATIIWDYLVLLSEISQKEEVRRLRPFELSRVPGTLLAPRRLGMVLLILSHHYSIVCLQ